MRRNERTAEPGSSPHLKRGQFFGTGHSLPASRDFGFVDAGLQEPAVEEHVLALLEACIRGRMLGEVPTRVPWWPRLVEYVEAHLGESIALDRAAAATGDHPTHLARTVRARTGATLGDYVRRRRIARAQAMLRLEPRRSLARVAFGLGFADHAHFSRTFKAITGLTPREFRAIA